MEISVVDINKDSRDDSKQPKHELMETEGRTPSRNDLNVTFNVQVYNFIAIFLLQRIRATFNKRTAKARIKCRHLMYILCWSSLHPSTANPRHRNPLVLVSFALSCSQWAVMIDFHLETTKLVWMSFRRIESLYFENKLVKIASSPWLCRPVLFKWGGILFKAVFSSKLKLLFVFKEDWEYFIRLGLPALALVSFDRDWDRSASREQGFSFAHESSAFQSHFIVMSTSPSLNLFDNKVGTNRHPASKPDSTDQFSTATLNRPSLDDNHSAGVVLLPTWLCTIQSSEDDSVMMRFFTPGGTEE
ncbi:hypothetical protein C8Q75DRAFT_732540 [Abortiporus biennis]|nr:hypothetical protein C8Q75DRAFT_732537 [Abortiporus biennis]KAI0790902.1 hypothetical protein C8Q75DRAFT_732540 [Abortiporus biennis]